MCTPSSPKVLGVFIASAVPVDEECPVPALHAGEEDAVDARFDAMGKPHVDEENSWHVLQDEHDLVELCVAEGAVRAEVDDHRVGERSLNLMLAQDRRAYL